MATTTSTNGHVHTYNENSAVTSAENNHVHRLVRDSEGTITGFATANGHTHDVRE